jgi:hypothetical protein
VNTLVRIVLSFIVLANVLLLGQTEGKNDPPSERRNLTTTPAEANSKARKKSIHLREFGIAAKASLLGGGVEVATPVTMRSNVRAGCNLFRLSRSLTDNNIQYQGQLNLKSIETHYDIFPFKGRFHISPGLLLNMGNAATVNAVVPQGQSFDLDHVTYISDRSKPVTGVGVVQFHRAAPMLTMGLGNLISRNPEKHFSVPFEVGFAYMGSAKATLSMAGNVCDVDAGNCRSVATDKTVQNQLLVQQGKINTSMSPYKLYPIVSIGFGYKF